MCVTATRTLTAAEQIANVRAALANLLASRRHYGRTDAIRSAMVQLAEYEVRHVRGEFPPVEVSDDCPF